MASPQTYRFIPLVRIPCDFPECETTFTRQQDMNRHKQEKHADAKHCPWCQYEAKRDQRLLAHIDHYHRPKKHRSSPGQSYYAEYIDLMLIKETDLSPSDQCEDPRTEDTAPLKVEVAEGESSFQAMRGGNGQGFGFGFPGERSLPQKDNRDHLPVLNQFVQTSSSSQFLAAGNQAILKQAYPAASSTGSGFPHLLNREIALRTSLSKGSRNLAAKPDLTSQDDWQNPTIANQILMSVNRPEEGFNATPFRQIQGYQRMPPHVQVLSATPPATSFSYNHTPFDEPATVPYMPSQQSPAFPSPQDHMQTPIISPIACYGQTQLPLQLSYPPLSANTQSSQPQTMSFADNKSLFFYSTPDGPPSQN